MNLLAKATTSDYSLAAYIGADQNRSLSKDQLNLWRPGSRQRSSRFQSQIEALLKKGQLDPSLAKRKTFQKLLRKSRREQELRIAHEQK